MNKPQPYRPGFADRPIVQLTLFRFRDFIREKEALFWAFAFPILMAVGLGIAFRNRPADVLNIGAVTPQLAQALRAENLLHVDEYSAEAGTAALRQGKVALIASPGANGAVVYSYDDSNPEGRTARMLADAAVQRAAGRQDPVRSSDSLIREAGSRYIDFLLPGLLGLNLMGNSVWGIGFGLVDARRRKLMKRLVATPMPRHYYLLSFLMSRLVLLVVEVVLIVGFGALVFGTPVRGPVVTLGALCLMASLSFGGLGLLIGSRVRTIEAASGIMNLVLMPMWILSGVFFSSQRFPDSVQPIIKALPLTAAIDALRANMLQGAGFAGVLPQFGILCGWLAVCFVSALALFRWK